MGDGSHIVNPSYTSRPFQMYSHCMETCECWVEGDRGQSHSLSWTIRKIQIVCQLIIVTRFLTATLEYIVIIRVGVNAELC